MAIKCIIVDDEPSSQTVLKHFISEVNFLELITTCNSALEANAYLNSNPAVDLLFLDINMPKLSGLSFYKSLKNPPKVIFTTAYSEYAVDGFEVNATDYLLKPFSFERFLAAINKVKSENESKTPEHTILIKSNKVLHKVDTRNIIYLEAFGDYVKVHVENDFILTNSTFTKMLEELPTEDFARIHKSFAINMNKLENVKGNTATVSGKTIPIGQSYKSDFINLLKQE